MHHETKQRAYAHDSALLNCICLSMISDIYFYELKMALAHRSKFNSYTNNKTGCGGMRTVIISR